MPAIESNGVRLNYEISGRLGAPLLVVVNSLGSNLHMWDKALAALEGNYHVLRSDMRGHGKSGVAADAFTIEHLGQDVLKLMDEAGAERASICGISLGGLVGLWLGIHAPHRVDKLILSNTAARIGTREMWEQRIEAVQASGLAALSAATLERWFTPGYRSEHLEEMDMIRAMIAGTSLRGYTSCCAVLRDTDLRFEAAGVKAATLVITGTHDPATSPVDGYALHASIEHSNYVELNASHMAAWECAGEFADKVLEHLATEVKYG